MGQPDHVRLGTVPRCCSHTHDCGFLLLQFCAVSGTNLQPQQANFPAFDFRSAACYPDDCDSSTHDEVVATWRYRVCGPALYATADCAAIDMDCAYDIR